MRKSKEEKRLDSWWSWALGWLPQEWKEIELCFNFYFVQDFYSFINSPARWLGSFFNRFRACLSSEVHDMLLNHQLELEIGTRTNPLHKLFKAYKILKIIRYWSPVRTFFLAQKLWEKAWFKTEWIKSWERVLRAQSEKWRASVRDHEVEAASEN